MPQGRVAPSGRHASSRVAATDPAYTPKHAPMASVSLLPPVEAVVVAAPHQTRSRRRRSALRRRRVSTVATVIVAVLAAVLVKMFVVQSFLIPSGSMEDTLQVGDRVVTNRLAYELHGIHRGDIVVFSGAGTWNGPPPARSGVSGWLHDLEVRAGIASADGTVYIKRVIGLPGDTVACCNAHGQVTVNGVALEESSYIDDDSYWAGSCPLPPDGISPRCFGPVTVAPGMLWVMGDHRSVSEDSRRHTTDPGGGAIESSRVVGKAVLVLWPLAHLRTLGTPTTFSGVPAVAMVTLPFVPRLSRRRRARRRGRPAGAPGRHRGHGDVP